MCIRDRLYEEGRGTDRDRKEAENWYLEAIGQNYGEAWYRLGRLEYAEDDKKSAYYLYMFAVMYGYEEAREPLQLMCQNGEGSWEDAEREIRRHQLEKERWKKK